MAGPQRAAQPVGDAGDRHGRELLAGIHLVLAGRVCDVAARLAQLGEVALLVAGIGGEILLRAELRRIDEDAGHRHVAAIERTLHQADMPLVQRAHGRHQPDGTTGRPEGRDRLAQFRNGAHHRETTFLRLAVLDHQAILSAWEIVGGPWQSSTTTAIASGDADSRRSAAGVCLAALRMQPSGSRRLPAVEATEQSFMIAEADDPIPV